jgi:type II secretory pathway pseudopilin PulG
MNKYRHFVYTFWYFFSIDLTLFQIQKPNIFTQIKLCLMKKIFILGVICLLCTISVIGQSKKEWERVQTLDATNVYEQFISNYPNGKYTELAKQKLAQLKEPKGNIKKVEPDNNKVKEPAAKVTAPSNTDDPIYSRNNESKDEDTDFNETQTSFVLGANTTKFRTSVTYKGKKESVSLEGNLGFQFGWLTDYPGQQKFGFQNGLLVSFENMDGDWLVNFRMPLLGTYHVDDKLLFQAGLNLDFWLCYMYEWEFEFEDESMNRWFNPSLSIGTEYRLSNKISIYGSYLHGLTNMIKSEYSQYDDYSFTEKKSIIQLGLKISR